MNRWQQLVQWFSPLVAESSSEDGFTLQDVLNTVGADYFHGFVTRETSEELLKNQSEGTFLLRFSQTSGMYAMSVCHGGNVFHWQISSKRSPTSGALSFTLDNNSFPSLQQLVSFHISKNV